MELLVKIRVLIPIQKSIYVMPVFIITKKEGIVRSIPYYHGLKQQLVIQT